MAHVHPKFVIYYTTSEFRWIYYTACEGRWFYYTACEFRWFYYTACEFRWIYYTTCEFRWIYYIISLLHGYFIWLFKGNSPTVGVGRTEHKCSVLRHDGRRGCP